MGNQVAEQPTTENAEWIDKIQGFTSLDPEHRMAGLTELYSLVSRQHAESAQRGIKQSITTQERNADQLQSQVGELRARFSEFKWHYSQLQTAAERLAVELEQTQDSLKTAINLLRLNGVRIPPALVPYC
jgi:predicted  nucleic acid-binding Zn-ribbon protein